MDAPNDAAGVFLAGAVGVVVRRVMGLVELSYAGLCDVGRVVVAAGGAFVAVVEIGFVGFDCFYEDGLGFAGMFDGLIVDRFGDDGVAVGILDVGDVEADGLWGLDAGFGFLFCELDVAGAGVADDFVGDAVGRVDAGGSSEDGRGVCE